MKVSYLGNLTSTFLLLTSFFCVQSAPARPLNERSTQFAWVILDEQQNSPPRRKITPKSIFISPSFGAQSCSTGYTLDASGRCVKVVKLNATAHEQFLLELLNQNFGNYGDYEDDEDGDEPLPTPGPFQLNIPLSIDAERDKISIVVAPTNGQFEDTFKVQDSGHLSQAKCNQSHVDAPTIITKIDINDTAGDQEALQSAHKTTTRSSNAPTTTPTLPKPTQRLEHLVDESLTTLTPTTTTTDTDVITRLPSTMTTDPTAPATLQDDLPADEKQAIFFKIPMDEGSTVPFDATTTTTTEEATPTTIFTNSISLQSRPSFDPIHFEDFFEDMKKQVNRRFIVKPESALQSEELLYNNHRNRDRWLFPRLLETAPKRQKEESHFTRDSNR